MYPGDIKPITLEEVALAIKIGRGRHWVGAGPDTRRPWDPVKTQSNWSGSTLVTVSFGPLFNVDSNKCSKKKQADPKGLK
jgi:hypothetical protein